MSKSDKQGWIITAIMIAVAAIAGAAWWLGPWRTDPMREAVRAQMKDPESAMFQNIRPGADGPPTGGRYTCGEINSRNSFGGYVGWQTFRASRSLGGVWYVEILDDEASGPRQTDFRRSCG